MDNVTSMEIEKESVVVLYDPKTGHIVHGHHHVTFKDGAHPDQQTLERAAFEHASRMNKRMPDKVEILHVDPITIRARAHYKVDIQKRILVEVEK
jgi:hypothetical protein